MRVLHRSVYLACFIGLAAVAALALNGAVRPSMSADLLRAVAVAAVCAAPGLVHRRLWPLVIILVPLGGYLVLRTTIPLPVNVQGFTEQMRFFGEQLQQGAVAYKTAIYPLAVQDYPGLQLLLAFTLYAAVAAGAFLALSLRRPVWAIVVILAVLGYSLTVDDVSRAPWMALLAVVLSVCLVVICRGLAREGWRLRHTLAGGSLGLAASLLAFGLLSGVPSVVATPWQDWRTWDLFGQSGSVYTFNWLTNYPRLLDPENNKLIMRVDSPEPCYWRASALDTFTGSAWVTSQAFLFLVESTEDGDSHVFALPETELMPQGRPVNQDFNIWDVYTNYFFSGGDPRVLTIDEDIRLRMNSMRSLRVGTALGPKVQYTVEAVIPEVDPRDLVGRGTDYPDDMDHYLALPFYRVSEVGGADREAAWRTMMSEWGRNGWEWAGLYALNQRIVANATDPYQITLHIERYLRRFYGYSLSLPSSEYSSPFAAFLFDTRVGYCQHFAGAMAVLLRYNGIPARVAMGFTSGEEQNEGTYVVSTNNAHAWVEAYFPTVGWVMFDPTPGRNLPFPGPSSTTPGFVSPFTDTDSSGSGALQPDDAATPITEDTLPAGSGLTGHGRSWLDRNAWFPWVAAVVAVAVAWPVGRGLWRRRGLHRGTPEERLRASLTLLRTDLSDYGVPATPAHTLEETLQVVEAHAGLEPDFGFAARAEAVLFGGRRARRHDVESAEILRRQTKTTLRRRHGWARTFLAWYGIPRFSRSRA